MRNFQRSIAIGLFFVGLILLFWGLRERAENPVSETIPSRAPASIADSRAPQSQQDLESARRFQRTTQLAIEQRRLELLRTEIENVMASAPQPNSAARDRMTSIADEMQSVQSDLTAMNSDIESIDENAMRFTWQERLDRQAQRRAVQSQIDDLNVRMAAAEGELRQTENGQFSAQSVNWASQLRAALTEMRVQKATLEATARGLASEEDAIAVNSSIQAQNEKFALRSEMASLQLRLLDLRDELNYWKAQVEAPAEGEKLRQARLQELQAQIAEQENRVNELRSQE